LEAKSDNAQAEILEQRWCLTEQTLLESGSMRVTCMARQGCPCAHIRNVVTVPMTRDGLLEGSISLQRRGDRDLDEYDASVLQILANQATVAIQNARLFEESQYLRAQTEELYRVAVEQKLEAERKRRELEMAQDEIDSMEREQIISMERERIARELHDDVAQILTSIGLNLEWCRQHLPPQSPVQERIACLKQLARNGLYEIRNAILGLSPTNIAELGLAGALEKLVSDFENISRIAAKLQVTGTPQHSTNGVENALYHICQEALYNVFKHAHAQHVQVQLVFESDATILTVADDGIGLSAGLSGPEPPAVTFGLKNMNARAEEWGGMLTISPGKDKGTRVVARIPGQENPWGPSGF
ncbi:MAG: GAF domain-containing sensor histidine kinase, partial [Chloroflexota bacterium]